MTDRHTLMMLGLFETLWIKEDRSVYSLSKFYPFDTWCLFLSQHNSRYV